MMLYVIIFFISKLTPEFHFVLIVIESIFYEVVGFMVIYYYF